MRTKIFTLFLALAASVGTLFAWDYERVQIGDLYYNLDATLQTAEVTSENSSYPFWSTAITTADIPASLTYNAVIYSVTRVGSYAFYGCSGLTSITIPNSVTNIGESAFSYCTSLTSITIPNSVTSIGWQAFEDCTGLTSIAIPNSVTSIGYGAFWGCGGLTSIIVEAGNTAYDSRNGCNAIIETASNTLVAGCQNSIILNSVTNIGDGAFEDRSGLTSITIPNSVTSIGVNAFWGCTGLTSVSIGNSVTSIGNHAFYNCSSLTTMTIPINVISIGYGAFRECFGLTAIDVATDNPNYCSEAGVLFSKDKTTLVAYPKGKLGSTYTIPNSVASIVEEAFADCSSLTSITIPNSVTSIGNSAFSGCGGLTTITIPNSVTSIGGYAFFGCSGLTAIEIPNSVASIGDYAFFDCSGLVAIEIPNSVTSIGWYAFFGCSGLTAIEIPNSVASIGDYAFFGCSSLTSVINYAITPQTIESNVFGGNESNPGVDKSIPLYVPAGSITTYQAADQWRDFTNIQAIPTMAITANEDPLNAGNYYTTFYHGTKRYRLPDNGTEAYVADLSGGELLLTRIAQGNQVLPNNVAVIFRAPTSTITLSETSTTGVSFSAENDLRGVDVVTPLENLGLTRSTCYVLSGNSTDGVGFYQCNSDNLKAHKAYLPYAGGPAGAPRHIRFVFDETEDLNNVQRNNVPSSKILRNGQLIIIRNGVEYNVAGQIVK